MSSLVIGSLAVLVGALLQRLSGVGAGLVVAPVMAILAGPVDGVVITNVTTIVSAAIIFSAVRADVEWRRFRRMLLGIVVGAVPGALVVRLVPDGWLHVLIGAMVLVGLWSSIRIKAARTTDSSGAAVGFGGLGSFLNTAAGVAAPVMVIYAERVGWNRSAFIATLQPTFFSMSLFSLISKGFIGVDLRQALSIWWLVPGAATVVALGLGVGRLMEARVSSRGSRAIAIIVAALGGCLAVLRGIVVEFS